LQERKVKRQNDVAFLESERKRMEKLEKMEEFNV
jgi:hypothetical protein